MRGKRMTAGVRVLLVCASIVFMVTLSGCTLVKHIPAALEAIVAENGSSWERVSEPGFGDENNFAVVAMKAYKRRLYAIVRNDIEGVEVWRTSGTGWEQVTDSGFRDDLVISFDAFAEFDGDLYVAGNKAANTVGEGFGGAKIYRLAR